MADRPKLLSIIVQDNESEPLVAIDKPFTNRFRYTRTVLQSALQLMGCKPRHAFKISKRVFSMFGNEAPLTSPERNVCSSRDCLAKNGKEAVEDKKLKSIEVQEQEVHNKCSTAVINRDEFLDVVCDALSAYRYVGPNQRGDLLLACRVRERKTSVTILLCGTSGCGKSTLSSLLASRLGITTVVSTDSIRHMMRSFVDEKENPLLWASTYHAGDFLDPVAVAEAKAKRKAKKMENISLGNSMESHGSTMPESFIESLNAGWDASRKDLLLNEASGNEGTEMAVSSKAMAVQGYKAQAEMVIDSLDRLITAWEQKCESVVVEGVHLSLNFVMGLMKRHPSVIPFMIYISNEEKHLERFAVRAKYMTLDPARNKYAKYIRNIRAIQEYACKRADKHLVPKVNNTNVDRSIAAIHATIFGCLRRREGGDLLYDQMTNTVKVIDEEYRNQCAAKSLGSKGMLQLLQRRGSSRQLMAFVNDDGSVAKAWPFESGDTEQRNCTTGIINGAERPMLEHLSVEKAQNVNLQFGDFGLSAWQTDLGGTSHNSSIDGLSSKGDCGENCCSHPGSVCSSSPRLGDGAEKELIDEIAVSGSEEEPEGPEADSDEDLDAANKQLEENELEGSIDDQSIRSDDDEEDLVAIDEQDDEYWPDNLSGQEVKSDGLEHIGSLERGKLRKNQDQVSSDTPNEKFSKSLKENNMNPLLLPGKKSLHETLGHNTESSAKEANAFLSMIEKHVLIRYKSLPSLRQYSSSINDSAILWNSKMLSL